MRGGDRTEGGRETVVIKEEVGKGELEEESTRGIK